MAWPRKRIYWVAGSIVATVIVTLVGAEPHAGARSGSSTGSSGATKRALPTTTARSACCSGRRSSPAIASTRCRTATRSSRRCSRDPRRAADDQLRVVHLLVGRHRQAFADALAERAKAGVQVRVLLDWLGSQKIDEKLLDEMRDAGVEIYLFHPLSWYDIARVNNRTHRKLLDRRRAHRVHGRRRHRRQVAGPRARTPTTGATPTTAPRARSSRRCRRRSSTTGRR